MFTQIIGFGWVDGFSEPQARGVSGRAFGAETYLNHAYIVF